MELIRAIGHAGGYVAAAYDDGDVVGGSLGFLGRHLGAPSLHSHVTGILPGVRRTGLGRAMKLHQRAWAAANGLTWVTWTFDPLVRRNAWFNLGVLGAVVHEYLVDFYGPIDDTINAGDESDRLLVAWAVGDGGPTDVAPPDPTGTVAVPTPADIVVLRRTDPAAAVDVAPPRAARARRPARRRAPPSSASPATATTSSPLEVHRDRPTVRAAGDPPPARRPVPDQLRHPDEPPHPARAGRGRARRRRRPRAGASASPATSRRTRRSTSTARRS